MLFSNFVSDFFKNIHFTPKFLQFELPISYFFKSDLNFFSYFKCHNSTGYCWCSTNTGTPIAGTTEKNKRPFCPPQGKRQRLQ